MAAWVADGNGAYLRMLHALEAPNSWAAAVGNDGAKYIRHASNWPCLLYFEQRGRGEGGT